jgi:hypothetical protein|tara:strand:- start:2921 stop:3109 length:189 start_codon:yes stop_codon:yes gene_type:complete
MNAPENYITYWYESADGGVEEFEVNASDAPPATLNMPTANGMVESYSLMDEECDDSGSIFDD